MPSSDNHASNGYWIHDDFGPRHYVSPLQGDAAAPVTEEALPRAIAAVEAMKGAERLHIALEGGVLHLKGQVGDAVTLSTLLKALSALGPFDARDVRIVALKI